MNMFCSFCFNDDIIYSKRFREALYIAFPQKHAVTKYTMLSRCDNEMSMLSGCVVGVVEVLLRQVSVSVICLVIIVALFCLHRVRLLLIFQELFLKMWPYQSFVSFLSVFLLMGCLYCN
eukprot:TRINITY_DN57775_c0_g1_i1.p3 TRINITY_DN57775_c0_g1~~TRINITY_DN57775_c0_g1_i1.p3  ORF type:complete len:119 (+),score=1.64 TRINITY_DN57775_c0_g1_i1:366-722(+)